MQGQSRLLLAKIYLGNGNADKVVAILQPLLSDGALVPAAFALAAEAELQRGDQAAADGYFKRAVELNPKDLKSRTALALSQVGNGSEKGFDELRAISRMDNEITADMALISIYVGQKKWDLALQSIDAIESKQRELPTAEFLRGRVEMARGDGKAAQVKFEKALQKDPKFYPAVSNLAALDLASNNPAEALKRYQSLLKADPKNIPAQLNIVELRQRTGLPAAEAAEALSKIVEANPTELAPRLALVRKQVERRELKLAVDAAQSGATALPDQVDILAALAQVQQMNGQMVEAISTVNKWIALQPSSALAQTRLADLYVSNKDKLAALQSVKRALTLNDQFLPAQRLKITLELQGGRIDAARQTIKMIQAQRPGETVGQLLEAELEISQKNWPAAEAAYQQALAKKPSTEVAIRQQQLFAMAGKSKEAGLAAAAWLKSNPNDSTYLYYMGDQALAVKNYVQAERYYRDVLKVQPDNANAMNNIAWLLNREKKVEAIEFAERAVKLQPQQAALLDTLAEAYATQGQAAKALAAQKQALALAPTESLHRLHLAKYYLAVGEKEAAKNELATLAALGNKFAAQDEVKKLADSL